MLENWTRCAAPAAKQPGPPLRFGEAWVGAKAPPYGIFCLAALVLVVTPLAAARADDLEAARQKIEAMSPEQKQELLRRYRQFMALPPEQRQRIRRLHRQLEKDRQGRELREVMHRYHAWIGTLPAVTRYELRDLEPAERAARVKQLIKSAGRGMRRPTPEDLEAIDRWIDQRVAKLEGHLKVSVGRRRAEQFARLSPEARRWLVMRALHPRRGPGGQGPAVDFQELAGLRDSLSEASREWLAGRPPAEQWKILVGWVGQAVRRHRGGPHRDSGAAAFGEHLKLDALVRELPREQQDHLLRLPPDEMQRELLKLYFGRTGGPEGPPPFGPPMRRPDHGGGRGRHRPTQRL